jgi:hypothetical protein
MSTLSQFSGGGVKSVQRGTIIISNGSLAATGTITAVDPLRSMVNHLGQTMEFDNNRVLSRISLANSTTVTANRVLAIDATTISYEVIEFY